LQLVFTITHHWLPAPTIWLFVWWRDRGAYKQLILWAPYKSFYDCLRVGYVCMKTSGECCRWRL